MTKHYIFKDDSWWDSNGCDCCDDIWMEGYNCISHGDIYYTTFYYDELYQVAIYHHLGYDIDDDDFLATTRYYKMNILELEQVCKELGITVEIVE